VVRSPRTRWPNRPDDQINVGCRILCQPCKIEVRVHLINHVSPNFCNLQQKHRNATGCWPSMLDSHHRAILSRLRWSLLAQSTDMLFSSWASWAGDWRRRPGMFELLRFCSNGSPLRCNDLTLFCCMMVLLMMTGQSRVATAEYFSYSWILIVIRITEI